MVEERTRVRELNVFPVPTVRPIVLEEASMAREKVSKVLIAKVEVVEVTFCVWMPPIVMLRLADAEISPEAVIEMELLEGAWRVKLLLTAPP